MHPHPPVPRSGPTHSALALAALAMWGCGSGVPEGSPHSALLLTLDTTVPEALSCYGAPDGLTPHLDALARIGVLYENARTVTPITAPSHASMLTGLYPVRHSVRMNGSMVLPSSANTLAEIARGEGLRTAAFVAAVVMKREFGLDQGFELYDEPSAVVSSDPRAPSSRPGAEVIDRAARWMRDLDAGERFFAWVHLFEPHTPYRPSDEHRARAGGNRYLGEVAYVDDQVGRLFEAMRGHGVFDRTMIIVVADHGEGLDRNHEKTHGTQVFDTTLAVPMIVRHVDGWRAGERSNEIVSVVDVFPTLVEALGLPAPASVGGDAIDGISLFRRIAAPDRGVYFETYMGHIAYGWSAATGWVDANGKYVHSSEPHFFDLARDPAEKTNLIEEVGAGIEPYRDAIARLAARSRLQQIGLGGDQDRLREQIEKLGYVGAGTEGNALPEPLEQTNRPAPIAMTDSAYDFLQAQKAFDLGRPGDAIPIVRSVIERDPTNHSAQILYGLCLMESRRFSQAIAEFERAAELRQGAWLEPELNIAVCYENLRRPVEAIEMYEIALANGGPEESLRRLIALLESNGRSADAEPYRDLLPKDAGE